MATPGYDPFRKLAEIFFQRDGLTAEELEEGKREALFACEDRSHPDGTSRGDRFMSRMAEVRGQPAMLISVLQADLVEGLLDCINPYQTYEPYTSPTALIAGSRHGVYDHFKGGVYLTRGIASWASGLGEPVVEYLSMIHGTKHVRLVSQWCEVVEWPDGKYRSRFVRRGADLTVPEPPFKVPSPQAH